MAELTIEDVLNFSKKRLIQAMSISKQITITSTLSMNYKYSNSINLRNRSEEVRLLPFVHKVTAVNFLFL